MCSSIRYILTAVCFAAVASNLCADEVGSSSEDQVRAFQFLRSVGADLHDPRKEAVTMVDFEREDVHMLPATALRMLARFPELEKIEIEELPLAGPHLEAIAALDGLKELKLARTGVDSAGIAKLRSLKNLRELDLQYNPLVGDEGLAHISHLSELRRLRLLDAGIGNDGLAHLSKLRALEDLSLDRSWMTDEGMRHLAGLTNLKELSLEESWITPAGLEQLSGLVQLTSFDLPQPPPRDDGQEGVYDDRWMRALRPFARLEQLWIYPTQVSDDGLAALAGLTELKDLRLNGENTFTDEGLRHLAKLTKLKKLHVESRNVRGPGVKHLSGLKQLTDLWLLVPIEGPGLEHLQNLKLEALILDSKLSPNALAYLKGPASLRRLYLNRTSVRGEDLKHLAPLTGLESLNLIGCQNISGHGLDNLKVLRNLESLNLSETSITDESLKHIPPLPELGWVTISSTPITDDGLQELARLPDLGGMLINGTKITDLGVRRLEERVGDKLAVNNWRGDTPHADEQKIVRDLWRSRHWVRLNDDGRATEISFSLAGVVESAPENLTLTAADLRPLKQLPMLEGLRLGRATISEDGWQALAELSQIRRLNLSSCTVSPSGWKSIERLKQLEELNLRETDATDDDLRSLSEHLRLSDLNLAKTQVRGPGLVHLQRLRRLDELSLDDAPLTEEGLRCVSRLTQLRELDLSGTQSTADQLDHLHNLKNLKDLRIPVGAVTQKAALKLSRQLPNCRINW